MPHSQKLIILHVMTYVCWSWVSGWGDWGGWAWSQVTLPQQDSQLDKSSPDHWPDLPQDWWPMVYRTDFDSQLDHWELSDDGWKLDKNAEFHVLSQFRKTSSFEPAVRSPFHRAILKSPELSDFQLDVKVLSTHPPYGHRDVCLFFGYQSPTQFYYVHLGELTDPHCNQIFIVNNQPRVSISRTTSKGTPWDDRWHHVRIIRKVATGQIAVYFDDMENPVMTAVDKTFSQGRVGLGSFDDTADWAEFRLRGLEPQATDQNSGSPGASVD